MASVSGDALGAVQEAHAEALRSLQALHAAELSRLRQALDAAQRQVRLRDSIIAKLIDEAAQARASALGEAPSVPAGGGAGNALCAGEGTLAPVPGGSVEGSAGTTSSSTEARSNGSAAATGSGGAGGVSRQALLSAVGSAQVDPADKQSLPRLRKIVARMKAVRSRIGSTSGMRADHWLRLREVDGEPMLEAPRRVADVLEAAPSTKLLRPATLCMRGVRELADGTFCAALRVRCGSDFLIVSSAHKRRHPVLAGLDADALERKFLPNPAARRVNFGASGEEWQMVGKVSSAARLHVAQVMPQAPGRDGSTGGLALPSATLDPATCLAAALFHADQVDMEKVWRGLGLDKVRPGPLPPLTHAKRGHLGHVCEAQPWLAPRAVGRNWATCTPRRPEHIAQPLHVMHDDARQFVHVAVADGADGAALRVWVKFQSRGASSQASCHVKLLPVAAALLADALQRKAFRSPSHRRVNFAEEAGEWQYVPVPRDAPSGSGQPMFVQYKPDLEPTPTLDFPEYTVHRGSSGSKRGGASETSLGWVRELMANVLDAQAGRRTLPPIMLSGTAALSDDESGASVSFGEGQGDSDSADESDSDDDDSTADADSVASLSSASVQKLLSDSDKLRAMFSFSAAHLRSLSAEATTLHPREASEAAGDTWLTLHTVSGADGEPMLVTSTPRTPADTPGGQEAESKEDRVRWLRGVRLERDGKRMCISVSLGATRAERQTRTVSMGVTAAAAACIHDAAQRALLPNPAHRRVNFAQEEGEWQYVVRRGKPHNAPIHFLQYRPSLQQGAAAGAASAAVGGAHALTAVAPSDTAAPAHSPAAASGRSARSATASPAAKRPRTGTASTASHLQRPPASLPAVQSALGTSSPVVDSDGYFSESSDVQEVEGGGDAPLTMEQWVNATTHLVAQDRVPAGQEESAMLAYLHAAQQAPARPQPQTATERAALHFRVNGRERRLYRCIRHCPTDRKRFALKVQFSAFDGGRTYETPFEAALAADAALRHMQLNPEKRLVNFKRPGSKEMQFIPCSKSVRGVVYRAVSDSSDTPTPAPGNAGGQGSPAPLGGAKRPR